ncbi:MAG: hypothetical protein KC468_38995, partial [Myxococcales bacterium]|nr:hypothetical protein [Myxococcales bacterium]
MSLAQAVSPATTQHERCAEDGVLAPLVERRCLAAAKPWRRRLVGAALIGVLAIGCKTQSPPLTNPFMAAESVTPP